MDFMINSKNLNHHYTNSISKIENLYDRLNERFFESALSRPVITVQPDDSCKRLGWFVPTKIWKDNSSFREFEINLSANFLDCSLEDAAAVLLHEMVHQFCYVNHIKDTSRSGTYHNHQFAIAATAHGLNIIGDSGDGHTELNEEANAFLKELHLEDGKLIYRKVTEEDIVEKIRHDALCDLKKQGFDITNVDSETESDEHFEEALSKALMVAKEKMIKQATRKCSTRKYECQQCGQSVRATKTVSINCGICDKPMIEVKRQEKDLSQAQSKESLTGSRSF